MTHKFNVGDLVLYENEICEVVLCGRSQYPYPREYWYDLINSKGHRLYDTNSRHINDETITGLFTL